MEEPDPNQAQDGKNQEVQPIEKRSEGERQQDGHLDQEQEKNEGSQNNHNQVEEDKGENQEKISRNQEDDQIKDKQNENQQENERKQSSKENEEEKKEEKQEEQKQGEEKQGEGKQEEKKEDSKELSEYEDIPEQEYQRLLQEAEQRKQKDKEDNIEGHEEFNYSVDRRRKKLKQVIKQQSPNQKIEEIKEELFEVQQGIIDWIKEKIQSNLLMFDETKHWKKSLEDATKKMVLGQSNPVLLIWIEGDSIIFSDSIYHQLQVESVFIFNVSHSLVRQYQKEQKIIIRSLSRNHLKSLVNFMNKNFVPLIILQNTWPDNVKKQFLAQLQKFMISITQICYQKQGYTELYIPKEDLTNTDGQDKDLIQRLQTTIIQWNRQIKEIVSNPDSHQQNQNSGPLDQIQYWRNRRQNLKHIDEQLQNPQLKQIVNFLQKMDSNDARGFGELAANIKNKSQQANDNLLFLQSLFQPCKKLEIAEPKQIPKMIPEILKRVRMIWHHSKYYKSNERISGLLYKISNEIIQRCKAKINVDDMLEGDVQKCIQDLNDAITCGRKWRQIYDKTAEIISNSESRKWDFSSNSIFASLEAFVQRCSELIQICQGQLQFALKGKDNALPKFSGSRTSEIVSILLQIKGSFVKLIDKFKTSKKQRILDVKASNWHDEYNGFKAGVKQLDVMYQNVIDFAFKHVTTVEQGVNMLEAFDYLAKRESIRTCVKKKAIQIMNLFIFQIDMAKQEMQQKKPVSFPLHHGKYSGTAILIRSIIFRLEKFKQKVDKLYFIDQQIKEPALKRYQSTVKQLESMIKDQKLAQWKQQNKIFEEPGNLNRSIQTVTILCRPDQHHEDYKLPDLLKPKKYHIQCNFDRKLLKLINQVSAWKVLIPFNVRIPNQADEFVMNNKQVLRVLREYAMIVVRDYNQIIDYMDSNERNLFYQHLQSTDKIIQPGISRYKWSSKSNVDSFLGRNCRGSCLELYNKLKQFKTNTQKIQQKCRQISSKLFLNINKKRSYLLTEFQQEQQIHRKDLKVKLNQILHQIYEILNKSYTLFANGQKQTQIYWFNYVKRIDHKIQQALKKGIKNSLVEFYMVIGDIDKNIQSIPIFIISAILERNDPPKLAYKPNTIILLEKITQIISSINDVISGLPKIENKMYEIYKEKRVEQLKKMQKQKNPNRYQLQESQINPIQGQPNYRISDDTDIQKYSSKIINNLNKVCNQVTKDSTKDKWTNSPLFWQNKRKQKFIKSVVDYNWMDITQLREQIENSNAQSQQIQEIKSSHPIGCIILDDSSFKQTLSEIVILWQNMFMSYLQERCTDQLRSLHDLFRTSQANLTPEPQDLHQLKRNTDLWQELMDNRTQFEKKLQPLKDKFAELDAHSIQLKEDENKLRATLLDAWMHYNEMLLEIQRRNQKVRSNFHYQATKNLQDFLKQASDLKLNFEANAPMQSTYTNETAFNILNQFIENVNTLRNRWSDMIFGFELFQITYTSPADLDHVNKEIKSLQSIWTLKENWDQNYQSEIKTIKFKDIDCQDLENKAEEYLFNLNQMSKQQHVRKWPITIAVKVSFENFKTMLPLIESLRKPYIRKRHWQQLQNSIDFDPNSQKFTYDEIYVQKNFIGYSDIINTTCQVARQQYKIQSALEKIKLQWQKLQLNMEVHKKTWKLKGSDAMFAILEEHMGVLSSQKTGLFYENFKDQIQNWQNNLQKVSQTLQMLTQVQRQWIYLQAIFASQQDQDRQLIGDINKFHTLNSRISVHMQRIHSDPGILTALLIDNFYNDLDDISKRLDQSQKVLFSLLQTKRGAFPRFYFLANDDLFELLGNSKDPSKVNKHIKKCFEGIKRLSIIGTPIPGKKAADNLNFDVVELISPQDQVVKLASKIPIENGVEAWLKITQKQMKQTLKRYLLQTFNTFCKKKDPKSISQWVDNHHGQLLITASQIIWTNDCQNILKSIMNSQKPDKGKAWKSLKEQKIFLLSQLTKQVRKATKNVNRLKLIALITIQVHARDITDELSKKCFSLNSFEWKKQLRFQGKPQGESMDCIVEQTNTSFPYGYEYQGNNGRLVVTNLTDRCYMTLTTAMHLKKGGAPQGPAGTGKTQTVKDLGKGLAKFVLVFNCSEGLDYKSLGRMFSGLMQTGGWGCFDQFNRIQLEVLSVVAQQMLSILSALKALETHKGGSENPFSFVFQGAQIPANAQCAIFITMNPGYAGRSQLPDNLKSLFRPISMMVPQASKICEIMLSSQGFKYGKKIADKIVVLYDLMSQQLSKQDHYDFGLRAIKSVLTCAGAIRREDNTESQLDKVDKKDKEYIKQLQEQQEKQQVMILMRAIMDMNSPKFVGQDIPLFTSLFIDLFRSFELQQSHNEIFINAIELELKKLGLIVRESQVKKIVQLYDSKNTRHGNMLVGSSMSGKSTCWKILKNVFNTLHANYPQKYPNVKFEVLNPKSIDLKELFGYMDLNLQWHQGVLSSMMGRLCKEQSQSQRWMILDGPVDTLWIQSMNTVLDDNKVLTLLNGDRISLPNQVGLIFQVEDLSVASPATVSRAGMIFVNLNQLGWRPYLQSWIQKIKDQQVQQYMNEMLNKWFVKLFNKRRYLKDQFKEHVATLQISIIFNFIKLFDSFLLGEGKTADFNIPNKSDIYWTIIQKWFIFCMIWAFGGSLDETGRRMFDSVIRDIESIFPGNFTVFDYYINSDKNQWHSWEDKLNNIVWKPPASTPYHSLLVPTVDLARTKYILQTCVHTRTHTLSIGATGTGKTVLINQILNELDENNWKINNIICSSQTSSIKTQQMIEGKMTRRTKTKMVPDGKKMVIYVDDLNMPKKDTYGSQPPLQLIRQWMDYGGWFDRVQNEIFKKIEDIQFISSMGPPGGGRNQISRRVQSKFVILNFTFPSELQVRRIFQNILSHKFLTQDFDDDIKQISETLSIATFNLYQTVAQNFLPTPAKSHYMFNMRDISKVIQGIYIFDKFYCDSKLTIFRLWVHQSLRVFHDRLISVEDRHKIKKLISDQLEQTLQSSMKQCTDLEENETIFVDFFDDSQNRQIYIQVPCKSRDELKKLIEQKLIQFNDKFKANAMNITLFQEAISYVCRINRIIKFSKGHGMLVGQGGAGRHSLTKLATFIAKFNLCQITVSKGFRLKQFREKIKQWSQQCAFKENTSAVFMFSDNQISQQSFVQDINTILTIGEIPNLFTKQDMPLIKQKMKKVVSRMIRQKQSSGGKQSKQIKDEVLLNQFYSRIQNNFHIVFLMSKTGDNLRNYGRMYPGLVNNTTIIYYMPWPKQALVEVANTALKHFDFDDDLRLNISNFFGNAHTKVIILAEKMWNQLKRMYYVTPTNYIQLVKGYVQLLKNKREQIGSQIEKLGGGLSKLDEAQANSNQLQKNLAIFQNELGKKSKDCEELMIKIDKETRQSKDKKNELVERETQVSKQKSEMQNLKADAEADLKKAEPALLAAQQGLANLTKDKLSVVKAYNTPPSGVDVVLNAVMFLLNKQASWATAKKQLADTSFLQRLQNIDKGRVPVATLKKIQKLTQDPKMQIGRIDTISQAAGGLWRWVLAVEGYAKAFKDIQPKKNKVNNLMEKLKRSEEQLQLLRDNFAKVQQVINNLNQQLQKAKEDMQNYKNQTQTLQIKLERAQKLITGLASTKDGWKDRKEKLQEKYSYIVGDSLMTAAYLSYSGPFPSEYRDWFLHNQLLTKVKSLKISHSKNYNFPEFLVKPVEFIKWGLKGLPDDQFSKQNGVLVRRGRMFPLLIDPQLQGNRWIREMQKQNKDKFVILDPQTENYMKTIELSIANGNIVMLQNLQEEIDSVLQPLLNKTIKEVAGRFMIYLGDKDIRYNENFRFFMTTKLPNPRYKAEVTTKVILVNFTVKQKGLQEQLTSVVIQRMQVQLETNKNELIKNKSENEQKMKKIDDGILKILATTKTNLIDDQNIIVYLQQSKQTEQKVRHQIQSSATQMKKILAARENYKKLAKTASKLFFIINDFALIESMYQFSLDAYIGLFAKTIKEYIEKPGLNDSLNQKLDAIAEKLKTGIYRYACRGLFEKDKLLLGFMMTVRLKEVDVQEYNFFLRGGRQIIDRKSQPRNPNQWIDPSNWNAICDLQKLPNFLNIIGAFIHNAKEWKKWYMTATPQKQPLPGEWNEKCDSIRRLIITKIIRADRVLPAVINFIVDKNGNENFVHPPNFSLDSVFADSNKNTPIIFVLSPGVDPYTQLQAFSKSKSIELVPVSLGQGQAKKAKQKVNEGAKNGSWLYLANCHLSLGFLKDLQKMLENFQMNKNDVHDKFRLWLSTNPHPKFPISILQRCVKITTEPPKGVKANLSRLFSNMPKDIGVGVTAANKNSYRRALFSLCWYHSLIIERKRFKTLGWNIIYDFNDSDFQTADKILELYIDQIEQIKAGPSSVTGDQPVVSKTPPWQAMRYLISQVTYGGRVTDEWDRRLLNVYANQYLNQDIISEQKHRLGNPNSNQYCIPDQQPPKQKNHETEAKYYMRRVEEFPSTEKPQIFGQHINAQISSQIADTNILLESLQLLQSSHNMSGDQSMDKKVKEIILELLNQLDQPFNQEQVYEKVKPQDQNPLKIVLIQEINRFNVLLKFIRKNIIDLQKGLNGLVPISESLEHVMHSLYENKVPQKWKFAYYSLKPLSLWMLDLNQRIDQLRSWMIKGQPHVFWISGFSFPTGFTTALKQQASRKTNIEIDQFNWQFYFEKIDSSISSPAKQGAYISGLFLQGAKWDIDKSSITQPQPMKLYYRMPIIQFKPVQKQTKQKVKKGLNLYRCPTYMYPIRTGIRQKPSFMFQVNLPIKPGVNTTNQSDQDFWIKRGTALLMSLAGEEI